MNREEREKTFHMSILLIHPPVAKPCEPPAGIAKLAGVIRGHGIACTVLDANLEGLLWLMGEPVAATDRWTSRAVRDKERNLAKIRDRDAYTHADRYGRVVADLNRLLERAVADPTVRISLTNYQDAELSPLQSAHLLAAAEHPERNPFYSYFAARLATVMEQHRPEVVGISLNFLNQAICAMALAGFLRQAWSKVPIIMGGGLVTSWMRQPGWANPFAGLVDEIVAGPGEGVLLARLGIQSNHSRLGFANHGTLPDYSLFPVRDYLAPGMILPYSASRGCYWNRCAFCPEQAEGNRYIPERHSRVATDLAGLVRKHGPALIHLVDNALSPALTKWLIKQPPGAPWYGFVRFFPELADLDFCLALRKSGCVMLKLGLESGSQAVLDAESKGVDLELASVVLRNLQHAGIATYVYLLFGTPSESEIEARATLEFIVRHSGEIGFLNLAIFNLPLAGRAREGLDIVPHSDKDLSLYAGFRHPRGWDRKRVRRFVDTEFRRHPAIAPILHRDPAFFTSNHAAFMPHWT